MLLTKSMELLKENYEYMNSFVLFLLHLMTSPVPIEILTLTILFHTYFFHAKKKNKTKNNIKIVPIYRIWIGIWIADMAKKNVQIFNILLLVVL